MTNGTVIEISVTGALTLTSYLVLWLNGVFRQGTAILLKPGIIAGGPVTHECPLSRSIGYFLEPVVMIAPFSKKPLDLTLKGVTTDDNDLSVSTTGRYLEPDCVFTKKKADMIRTVTLPHLELFGISDGLELRVSADCLNPWRELLISLQR